MTYRQRAVLILLGIAGGVALAWTRLPLALPATCLFRRLTGWPCPSCGLTRATCALAHGQWREAEHFNLAAIPLAFLGLAWLAGLMWGLWSNRPVLAPAWRRSRRVLAAAIVALMATAWVCHFVPGPF
jgi:hypothetical protein